MTVLIYLINVKHIRIRPLVSNYSWFRKSMRDVWREGTATLMDVC